MTKYVLSSGHTSGYSLSSSDTLTVLAGGTSDDSTVRKGAVETVSAGGSSLEDIISGGELVIADSGYAFGATISSGGVETVLRGASSYDEMVESGGRLTVSSGGQTSYDTVYAGGKIVLAAGAVVNGDYIEVGGSLSGPGFITSLYNSGSVSGAIVSGVSGSFDSAALYDFGAADAVVVSHYADLILEAGGTASGDTVLSGGELILSGGTATHVTVSKGGALQIGLTVSSGHTVSVGAPATSAKTISGVTLEAGAILDYGAPQVLGGGTLDVGAGAVVAGALVSAGGKLNGPGELDGGSEAVNEDAGLISGVTLGDSVNAGYLYVGSGGVASSVTLVQGYVEVDSGGRIVSTTVKSGGFVNVMSSGVAVGAVVSDGATLTVSSGGVLSSGAVKGGIGAFSTIANGTVTDDGTANGLTIGVYGVLTVESGGKAANDKVLSGGTLVLSGGTAASDTVSSGGLLEVSLVVSSGKTLKISAGGTGAVSGVTLEAGAEVSYQAATVLKGGTLEIDAGAVVSNAVVSAGGKLNGPGDLDGYSDVYGTVSGVTVSDAETYIQLTIEAGGVASSVALDTEGAIDVTSGGKAYAVKLSANGDIFVEASAVAVSTHLLGGEMIVNSGGVASDTVIAPTSSAADLLDSGRTVSTVVSNSGYEQVTGSALDTRVGSGGLELVSAGGRVTGTLVEAGGAIDLLGGAIASGVTVQAGGVADLAATISGKFDLAATQLAAAITLDGVTVDAGASLVLEGATVAKSATLILGEGVVASGLTVLAGGVVSGPGEIGGTASTLVEGSLSAVQIGDVGGADFAEVGIRSGGLAHGVALQGGELRVSSGGRAVGTVIDGSDVDFIVSAGGVASGTVIAPTSVYAYQTIDILGSALGTIISDFGTQGVDKGGVASATHVLSGGAEVVFAGGKTVSGVVSSGGFEVISSGGAAAGLVVDSGGDIDFAAVISAHQSYTLSAASVAKTTTVDGVTVDAGGKLHFVQAQVLSAGTLVLASGAVAEAVVVAAGGRVDGPGEVANYVTASSSQGIGSTDAGVVFDVRLGDVDGGYGALTVASKGAADTVTVVDGLLVLLSGGLASGVVVDDGGNQVTVDKGAVASRTVLGKPGGQGAANALTLGSAVGTVASNGGAEYVASGGVSIDPTVSSGGREVIETGGHVSGAEVLAGGAIVLSSGFSATAVTVSKGGVAEVVVTVAAGKSFVDPAAPLAKALTYSGVTVDAGGYFEIIGATVASGATLSLAGGATASGVNVVKGGHLTGAGELAGGVVGASLVDGTASGETIGDKTQAGQLFVGAGATAAGIKVAHGELAVQSGGAASGAVVSGGGQLVVLSGGSASAAKILAGADEILFSGGVASKTVVSSGGAIAFFGGVEKTGRLVAGKLTAATTSNGVSIVAGGIIDYGRLIMSGGALALAAGGTADTVVVSSAATISGAGALVGETHDAGLVSGVTVEGFLDVLGVASGVTLGVNHISAGYLDVESGGVARTVRAVNGALEVLAHGVASAVTLIADGVEVVESGGRSADAVISSGGEEFVASGGVDDATIVSSGGFESIVSGALASGVTVSSGGQLQLDLTLSSHQSFTLPKSGGSTTISGVSVRAGGELLLGSATVLSGGKLTLAAGAVDQSDITVSAGGVLAGPGEVDGPDFADDYGLVSGVVVGDSSNYDAGLTVESGAVADAITMKNGTLDVTSGGYASAVVVDNGDVFVVVSYGGLTSDVTVKGALEYVEGVARITALSSGAYQDVYGEAIATTVSRGAFQVAEADSLVSKTVVESGGVLGLVYGSLASAGVVESGGDVLLGQNNQVVGKGVVLSAKVETAVTTTAGLAVSAGGMLGYEDVTVGSGGAVHLGAGGAVAHVTIDAGGVVSGSGAIYGSSLDYGSALGLIVGGPLISDLDAELDVMSKGLASALKVDAGGYLLVSSGGSATADVISSGGQVYVFSGAAASTGKVLAGGRELVESGAKASGTTVSSGGELAFYSGGVVSAHVKLVDGAVGATTKLNGVTFLAGGVVDYGAYAVESGGVFVVTAKGSADDITIQKGAVVSGDGELGDDSLDDGLVSGLQLIAGDTFASQGFQVGGGGEAVAVSVDFGATMTVSAGGVTKTDHVSGVVSVLQGATDSGGSIASGGEEFLEAGAKAVGVVASSGARLTMAPLISSGQDFTISASPLSAQTVLDGATVKVGGLLILAGATVASGGVLTIASGATVSGATVLAGGVLDGAGALGSGSSFDYGLVSGVAVSGDEYYDTTLFVESGGAAVDTDLALGALEVTSGGVISAVVATGDAVSVTVDVGGIADATQLGRTGAGIGQLQTVYGSAAATEIYSGASELVASSGAGAGGVTTSAIVFSGGVEAVTLGGHAIDTLVLSGGLLQDAGLITSAAIASGGAVEFAAPRELASGALLEARVVTAVTSSGGAVIGVGGAIDWGDVTVGSGATLSIGAGAAADSITVVAGGLATGGGQLIGYSFDDGDVEGVRLVGTLYDDGVANHVVVSSVGSETIGGGVASDTAVLGSQFVGSGGVTIDTRVSSGGLEDVGSAGTASATTVYAGGDLTIEMGAVATGAVVSSGGVADLSTVIAAGQTETLISAPSPYAGAHAFQGITIESGGSLLLQSAVIVSKGRLDLAAGSVFGAATISSGGALSGSGTATGAVSALSGATIADLRLSSGGTEYFYGGAKEVGVVVSSGGTLDLVSGAVASGATVVLGTAAASLAISGATLSSGATLTAQHATVSKGGVLSLTSSGEADDVATIAGARIVDNGSITYDQAATLLGSLAGDGEIVVSSGVALVQSASAPTFAGDVVLAEGSIVLAVAGGLGSGWVDFEPSEAEPTQLVVDAAATPASGATFGSTLDDFSEGGESVDLKGLTYSAGASATVKGELLTLVDGAKTLKFNLFGTATTTYTVANDGSGGVLITPDAPNVRGLAQSMASFNPQAASGAAPATQSASSAGATRLIFPGPKSEPHLQTL